ncbi:MAG: hypothetical protein LBH41_01895, partial [Rickettsiales bacterium]|nr:hypothetical protein [Rickettsiales bacterium]
MSEEKKSLKQQYEEARQRAFLREVQEEADRDRALAVWHKYKAYIISAAAAVLIGAAGVNWHRASVESLARDQAVEFERIMAMPSDERLPALKAFAESAEYAYRDI